MRHRGRRPDGGAPPGDSMTGTEAFPRHERVFLLLAGTFLVSLVVANLITAKLFVLFGVVLAAGIIPYPVTFLVTDLICEVYGQKRANALVVVGFVLSLYTLLILQLGGAATPFEGLDRQAEYEVIFGSSARAIVASMVAYLVAQLVDVRLFHWWKARTGGRHLWLRNNGSTMFSQVVDTVLVVSILFGGELPLGQLFQLMVASYVFKFVIAFIDTPLFYAGSRYLRRFVTASGDDGGPTMRLDGPLLLACCGNVCAMVGAASWWQPGEHGAAAAGLGAVGVAALICGVGAHVLTTVAFAQPGRARIVAAGLILLGLVEGGLAMHADAPASLVMAGAALTVAGATGAATARLRAGHAVR